jgi:PPK2 family polyphosphate:nucleotide phosphotransferase
MFKAPESDFLVPFDGTFRIADTATKPAMKKGRQDKKRLKKSVEEFDDLQQALYASNRHALLLVFQGMDAAGKDSTIRSVLSGINPAGCQVFSFKKPSALERDHDFLWRTSRSLPERGRIGVFNRSHYEEVLVVRVHPGILQTQQLPDPIDLDTIWEERFESIRNLEKHLARNGTVIVKFWLNVSKKEQKKRLLDRLNTEKKQWKFRSRDLVERESWDDYMAAFENALNATSRPWAPWYAIPADNKPYMRSCVAEIIVATLSSIGLQYPQPSADERATFAASREALSGPTGK